MRFNYLEYKDTFLLQVVPNESLYASNIYIYNNEISQSMLVSWKRPYMKDR